MWLDLWKASSMHKTAIHTFHHQTITVHINQQFRQVLVQKFAQAAFVVTCFEAFQIPMSAWFVFKWLHFPLTSRQPAVIYHTDNWMMSLAMGVWYVEVKMAPMDAIWLFSMWLYPGFIYFVWYVEAKITPMDAIGYFQFECCFSSPLCGSTSTSHPNKCFWLH